MVRNASLLINGCEPLSQLLINSHRTCHPNEMPMGTVWCYCFSADLRLYGVVRRND